MSQCAVPIACHTPFRSGWPSKARETAAVCAATGLTASETTANSAATATNTLLSRSFI